MMNSSNVGQHDIMDPCPIKKHFLKLNLKLLYQEMNQKLKNAFVLEKSIKFSKI